MTPAWLQVLVDTCQVNSVRSNILYLPKSIVVDVSGSVRIESTAWGWEIPTIAWYRAGRLLGTESIPPPTRRQPRPRWTGCEIRDQDFGSWRSVLPNTRGVRRGVLKLHNVRSTDRAVYNCTATNSFGSAYRSTLLRVRGESSMRGRSIHRSAWWRPENVSRDRRA
jgi:hypothetical protein